MATAATLVRTGTNWKEWLCETSADADTSLSIAHGFGGTPFVQVYLARQCINANLNATTWYLATVNATSFEIGFSSLTSTSPMSFHVRAYYHSITA